MRKEIKEFMVYNVQDLQKEGNEAILEKVLEKNIDINTDSDFWFEGIKEDWEIKLEDMGYSSTEISFSGFYNQGDGASFVTDSIFLDEKIIKRLLPDQKFKNSQLELISNNIQFRIKRDSYIRYYHEKSVYCDCTITYTNRDRIDSFLWDIAEKLTDALNSEVRDLSLEIYKDLKSEYEALQEKENILDILRVNNYEFTEDGEIF